MTGVVNNRAILVLLACVKETYFSVSDPGQVGSPKPNLRGLPEMVFYRMYPFMSPNQSTEGDSKD